MTDITGMVTVDTIVTMDTMVEDITMDAEDLVLVTPAILYPQEIQGTVQRKLIIEAEYAP